MKKFSSAFLIAFTYFVISFFWILFSDKILISFNFNNEILTTLQTIKGWFFITVTSIYLYYLMNISLKKLNAEKEDLEEILNSLASPVMIINEDGEILKVNRIFKKLTGYAYQEINTVEKWTSLAYEEKAEEVKKTFELLYKEKNIVDNGDYTIITKSGKKRIWHFNTAPYGIKNGKKTIIATALDITNEKEKEKLLMQQSKMAAMGEILENIAHQWRQPLSTISTAATGVKLQNELDTLNDKILNDSMNIINNSAQYLSKTIDDFRGFFKPDQKSEYFKINHTLEKIMMIIGNKYKLENIHFIKDIENFQILNYNNALIQVFINLFSNSQHAFLENDIKDKFIFIDVYNDEYSAIIEIKDTAGGIPSKIIDKIFEPYFTTKHQSRGTGIGLYMSEEIITKHMKGTIHVKNKQFTYKKKVYTGAMFTITLPLKI